MSDGPTINIGGKSEAEMALLMTELYYGNDGIPTGDELLKRYRQILAIVKNPFSASTAV
jgi:hypothetical protein